MSKLFRELKEATIAARKAEREKHREQWESLLRDTNQQLREAAAGGKTTCLVSLRGMPSFFARDLGDWGRDQGLTTHPVHSGSSDGTWPVMYFSWGDL